MEGFNPFRICLLKRECIYPDENIYPAEHIYLVENIYPAENIYPDEYVCSETLNSTALKLPRTRKVSPFLTGL